MQPTNRLASHTFTVYVVTDGIRIRNVETDRVAAETRARFATEHGEGWFTVTECPATLETQRCVEAQR